MSEKKKQPICVDLDGTLIRTDLLQEGLPVFIRENFFKIFCLLLWFLKGRARLKTEIAERTILQWSRLPYNYGFIETLKERASQGHELYLVSASAQKVVQEVADHVGIFKGAFGSSASVNLRAGEKASFLKETFGEKGFIYAGNSADDLKVWCAASKAIAVNTPSSVLKKLKKESIETEIVFEGDHQKFWFLHLFPPFIWGLPMLIFGGVFANFHLRDCLKIYAAVVFLLAIHGLWTAMSGLRQAGYDNPSWMRAALLTGSVSLPRAWRALFILIGIKGMLLKSLFTG